MERKVSTGTVGVGYDSRGNKLTQSSVVSNHALKLIGKLKNDGGECYGFDEYH